jgi:uncharacterized protein involved in exopolysaccharide biosynthesis
MSGVRARLAWIVNGRANTASALDGLSADLRALQERVDSLQADLHALRDQLARDVAELRQRQLTEFDAVRAAVAQSTDDLTARVVALREQVEGTP